MGGDGDRVGLQGFGTWSSRRYSPNLRDYHHPLSLAAALGLFFRVFLSVAVFPLLLPQKFPLEVDQEWCFAEGFCSQTPSPNPSLPSPAGAAPGDLLHFGAWPKSPVAPRLAQTLNALERAPPAARSWDAVTGGKGGSNSLVMARNTSYISKAAPLRNDKQFYKHKHIPLLIVHAMFRTMWCTCGILWDSLDAPFVQNTTGMRCQVQTIKNGS